MYLLHIKEIDHPSSVFLPFKDASSQPIVRFPQSLLNLTHSRNLTSVKAFVTVPKLIPKQDDEPNNLGIVSNKSGVAFTLQKLNTESYIIIK